MIFRLAILLLLAAAGLGFWQAEQAAALQQRVLLRSIEAQLAPYGTLSHGEATAHFWGRGSVQNLRFTPNAALRTRYRLPADFALVLPELRYHNWQQSQRWPSSATVLFEQAQASLPEPWPVSFQGSLVWSYEVATGNLTLRVQLTAARAGTMDARLALVLDKPEQLAGARLFSATLDYQDLGLAQEQRVALSWQQGATSNDAEQALATVLGDWLSRAGLPLDAAAHNALRRFAREPLSLTVQLDPPGVLRPETLGQFAPEDRQAALGLQLLVPDHH